MDCKTARLLLDLYRPGAEIDPTETAALEGHFLTCPECATLAQTERQADVRLARAMQTVAVPEALPARILTRLALARRLTLRRRYVRASRWLAAAAAFFLALGGGSWWWATRRPALDLVAIRDAVIYDMASPRQEWLEERFAALGAPTGMPPQFDYSCLVHYGLGDCQGKRVPYLVFARGETRAAVYVVSGKQFNLQRLPEDTAEFDTQGFSVVIFRDAEANSAYLVIHTGPSLAPVLAGSAG